MRIPKLLWLGVACLFYSGVVFSQQLKLGKNPYTVQKSALLELNSDNQGLLLVRISDTTSMNTMAPPDGMIIYFIPTKQLYVRSGGFWKAMPLAETLGNYWSVYGNTTSEVKKLGSTDNYDVGFITNNTERMRLSNTGNLGLGTSSFDASNPEKLLIDGGTGTSFNLIKARGTLNNYLQLNIQNQSAGAVASADMVATADNGNETTNYIDMGINSSGFTDNTYPILSGINNAYLYSTGSDFMIGNATANKNLRLFTGGYTTASERMRITGTGLVGIGTTAPTNLLHLKTGVTDSSGLRLENLTSASGATTGASVLGVDATGRVVKAKKPVYYSGGIGGSATVDGITKVWVAEVTNAPVGGVQTITIPANVAFSTILNIQVTAKGGGTLPTAPIATVESNTTSTIVIRVLESKTTTIVIGGTTEGLEQHTSGSTTIYIRVEGN